MGTALTEGRKLFASNEQFGEWVRSSQLDTNVYREFGEWCHSSNLDDQFREWKCSSNLEEDVNPATSSLDSGSFHPTWMEPIGETARLAMLAREGLRQVAAGEQQAMNGWLVYGAALNEGRKLFPSNEQFGQWVKGNLPETEQKEREAAMWASN